MADADPCEKERNDYKNARKAVNDLRRDIRDLQQEQMRNAREYWYELAGSYLEYLTLGAFSEGPLGLALGVGSGALATGKASQAADDTHAEIEETGDDLEDADSDEADAEEALCACEIENGQED